jgi:hippurate hydrolase
VGIDLVHEARQLLPRTVELRRRIHSRPELGLSLPVTQQSVLEDLDDLGLDVSTGEALSSVVAVLEGDRPGPTTLLRGDMDALPLHEDTGLPYSSKVDGAMHACGHDAHVAMLTGAARLLARHRRDLAGRVVFMFQPGEEGHAGAKVMLDEGLLDRHGPVDRAFALHIAPILPSGSVAARPGTMLASADEFEIVVTGKGGHASMPHDAVDPIPVACEIVTAFQSMVTRRISAFDPAVVTIASVHAGTTFNVIPETALLKGTVRAVSNGSRDEALAGVKRVAELIAAAHLCTAAVAPAEASYPVTVNDSTAAEEALAVARSLIGQDKVIDLPAPVMGAEDWSFVLQRVPGSMAFLGAAPPGVDNPAPNHSNRMVIDEDAMAVGVALHAAVALH